MLAQKENVIGKKDFGRPVRVPQVFHFRDDFQVLADAHAIVADRAGVIAAEGAMVGASPRRKHRVMSVLREIIKASIHDWQIIERGGLAMSCCPDHFTRAGAEQQARQVF